MKKLVALILPFVLGGCSILESLNPWPNSNPTPIPNPTAIQCPAGCIPAPTPTPLPTPTPAPIVSNDIGHDELGCGAPHYTKPFFLNLLNSLTESIPFGCITDGTFGPPDTTLNNIFATHKISAFRAHLLNSTCVTNSKCWGGDMLNGYTWPKLEAEAKVSGSRLNQLVCNQAKKVESYAQANSGVKFYVSGLLEHHLTQAAAQAIVETIKKCAPSTIPVDSPGGNPPYVSVVGAKSERHGFNGKGEICSLDGNSAEDQDMEKWKDLCADAELRFIWGRCKNGRTNSTAWVQPNLRDNFCTEDQTFWLDEMRDKQDPAPPANVPFCKSTAFPLAPTTWKTSAEDKDTGDNRANKPLLISKFKDNFDIVAQDGIIIGRLAYYGPFTDPGLFRAYTGATGGSNHTALQLSKLARQHGGTSWVYLRARGSGACVLVDSLRRSGTFHAVKKPTLKAIKKSGCDQDCEF